MGMGGSLYSPWRAERLNRNKLGSHTHPGWSSRGHRESSARTQPTLRVPHQWLSPLPSKVLGRSGELETQENSPQQQLLPTLIVYSAYVHAHTYGSDSLIVQGSGFHISHVLCWDRMAS